VSTPRAHKLLGEEMLTLGPFQYDAENGFWHPSDSSNACDIEELCDHGFQKAFPSIAHNQLVEVRLYPRRPKGLNVLNAELRVNRYWRRRWDNLKPGDEETSWRGEVDTIELIMENPGSTVDFEKLWETATYHGTTNVEVVSGTDVVDMIMNEFDIDYELDEDEFEEDVGKDWDTIVLSHSTIERYFAYVKAVPVGEVKPIIEDAQFEEISDDTVLVSVLAKNGMVAQARLNVDELEWTL
jgi:hypothetical protein